jgi:RNA polymerase sigma factor (sigma-70 family)
MTADDEALVTRCLAGEARAWDALVSRHGALVWAVARRAGLTPDDEADVFQNTWHIAIEELPRLRRAGAFSSWIAGIARHQTMRVRRGYGIARRAMPHVAKDEAIEAHPDAPLSELEERQKVATAIERIGRRCRDLLRALYYEDDSPAYSDVASRLAMPIGSIGPTRARCLEKLEKEMTGRAGA